MLVGCSEKFETRDLISSWLIFFQSYNGDRFSISHLDYHIVKGSRGLWFHFLFSPSVSVGVFMFWSEINVFNKFNQLSEFVIQFYISTMYMYIKKGPIQSYIWIPLIQLLILSINLVISVTNI